jgi:hypothetical protein
MSRPTRTQFSARGDVYLLVQEWAVSQVTLPDYERVEGPLADKILASLPPAVGGQPALGRMLSGAVQRSPASRGSGAGRLALFRRVPIPARPFAPPEQEPEYEPAWQPEPPPLLESVVELAAQAAIAATLIAAAANGAPFCEKCENCQ